MSNKIMLDKIILFWYNIRITTNTVIKAAATALGPASPYKGPSQLDIVGLSIGVLSVASYFLDAPTGVVTAGFLGSLFASKPGTASAYAQGSPQFQDIQRLQQAAALSQNQANQLGGGAQQGLGAQSAVLQQLMMQAQGQGPNPAQAALANATGQNVANQFAQAASGAAGAMNPALAQRQAMMAGAGIQQDAAGQSALMQAQQQLAAQQAAGALGGQLVGQQQQGQQIANQMAGMGAQLASQDIQQFNSANASKYGAQVGANAGQGGIGGALGQIGTGIAGVAKLFNKGGEVPGKAQVPGDSEKNDTVPVLLSPGEIVVPRSYASDPKAAAAFAHACALFSQNKKD